MNNHNDTAVRTDTTYEVKHTTNASSVKRFKTEVDEIDKMLGRTVSNAAPEVCSSCRPVFQYLKLLVYTTWPSFITMVDGLTTIPCHIFHFRDNVQEVGARSGSRRNCRSGWTGLPTYHTASRKSEVSTP